MKTSAYPLRMNSPDASSSLFLSLSLPSTSLYFRFCFSFLRVCFGVCCSSLFVLGGRVWVVLVAICQGSFTPAFGLTMKTTAARRGGAGAGEGELEERAGGVAIVIILNT